jgi:OmpA family
MRIILKIVATMIAASAIFLLWSTTVWAKNTNVGAPTFKWSSSDPITGRDFRKFKTTTLTKLPRNTALEITGLYSAAEQQAAGNPSPNLGIARAAKVAALFVPSINSNKIKIASALVTDDGFTDATKKMAPFSAVSFAEVALTKSLRASVPAIASVPILFPINMINRHPNPRVSAYLRQIAELLKPNQRRVMLIGYSDRRGASETNLRLANQRAESIRAELTKLGVSASQIDISVQSRTDDAPQDDSINARQLRRRVEIIVL